ncbi:hypothetical protein ACNKHL_23240 [Shigella flexneri]
MDEVQQKVAIISGNYAKTWLLAQAIFRRVSPDGSCGAIRTSRPLPSPERADASLADMNDPVRLPFVGNYR